MAGQISSMHTMVSLVVHAKAMIFVEGWVSERQKAKRWSCEHDREKEAQRLSWLGTELFEWQTWGFLRKETARFFVSTLFRET